MSDAQAEALYKALSPPPTRAEAMAKLEDLRRSCDSDGDFEDVLKDALTLKRRREEVAEAVINEYLVLRKAAASGDRRGAAAEAQSNAAVSEPEHHSQRQPRESGRFRRSIWRHSGASLWRG
jgi:hypothetical protein